MRLGADVMIGMLVLVAAAGCNEHIYAAVRGTDAGFAGQGGFAGFAGQGGFGGGGVAGMAPPGPGVGPGGDAPITCDSVVCPPLPDSSLMPSSPFLSPSVPCCTEQGRCGVANSTFFNPATCLERDAVGQASVECPSEVVMGIPMPSLSPGCCRPDGRCGLAYVSPFGGEVGGGCTERAQLSSAIAGSMLANFGGAVAWSSSPCTYVMEATEDSGAPDDTDAGVALP